MEIEQNRRKTATLPTATATTTSSATPEDLLQAHDDRPPMGRVGEWMGDFGFLGAVTGLVAAITYVATGAAPVVAGVSTLVATPILLGFAATLAGAVAGGVLRVLRGKVPAVLGVLIAGMGVNLVGSLITVSLPWHRLASASIIEGNAAPLSLAVLLLIPVVAVLRWRKQSPLPWLTVAGALAGLLIGLS